MFSNLSSLETKSDILVFQDVLNMIVPDWALEPFSITKMQEEMIELSTNEEFKLKFKNGYQAFCLQSQILKKFPA